MLPYALQCSLCLLCFLQDDCGSGCFVSPHPDTQKALQLMEECRSVARDERFRVRAEKLLTIFQNIQEFYELTVCENQLSGLPGISAEVRSTFDQSCSLVVEVESLGSFKTQERCSNWVSPEEGSRESFLTRSPATNERIGDSQTPVLRTQRPFCGSENPEPVLRFRVPVLKGCTVYQVQSGVLSPGSGEDRSPVFQGCRRLISLDLEESGHKWKGVPLQFSSSAAQQIGNVASSCAVVFENARHSEGLGVDFSEDCAAYESP
ncbi:DLG4 protein, partial [Polyodon spathula]|nr:DLG4 protein [Polyodon spathula]